MTVNEKTFKRLTLAVKGPYDPVTDEDNLEYLIWLAGQHRRELEDSHAWLDMHGVPRSFQGANDIEQIYTLRGRLEQIR